MTDLRSTPSPVCWHQAADGVLLGYQLWRCGHPAPVMLMLHGLASNLTRWSEFVEQTQLRTDWDLMRIDLRGHGSSICHGHIQRRHWVEDVHALLAGEGYPRAVLAGHSLGAQVALAFAHQYPERCAGLILIDPVFPSALRGGLRWARRLRPLLRMAARCVRWLNGLGLGRRDFPARDLHRLDQQTRQAVAETGADIARLYTNPWADLRYLPLANYLQDLCEVTRPLPAISSIEVPVLVLLSSGNDVTARENTLQQLATLPQLELRTLDAKHWLLTERPVEARAAIEQWCATHFTHRPSEMARAVPTQEPV